MYVLRKIPSRALGASIAALILGLSMPAQAGDFLVGGGGGDYKVRTKTLLDSRFRNVVRQRYDFSCGSAAVATLLRYHYEMPVDEMDVLQSMYLNGDQEKIKREGFSMLDMKNYLGSMGYRAEGYRESLDKLARVGIPAIVLVNKKGYMHFVVIKGVSKEKVAVGDPTLGLRIYERSDFEKMWNGILFVVLNDKRIAQASFNTRSGWHPFGKPNFQNMLNPDQLNAITIDMAMMPGMYW